MKICTTTCLKIHPVTMKNDNIKCRHRGLSIRVSPTAVITVHIALTSSEFLLTASTLESSWSHGDILATTSIPQSDTADNKQSVMTV